ncbi:MAG: tetratricopeptide repeat protein, partial [Chloroflexota bacterium]
AGVLSSIVPDITALLGRPIPPVPVLDGEAAQIRLLTTIAKLFTEATQPVLLIMEDLHWATAGLAVLPYLTRQIDKATLLVIGSYRDDEHPTLAQTLSDMQPLPLNRLTTDNMADLSAAMLGERGQRPDILQRLQQETEGNAFFAVEVLRLLAEDMGGLSHIGDAPLPDLLLPDGIQGIVQRRLMRVPQQYHHLLQLAATAGRILDMHILEALSDHHHLERWLTTCAEAAVLDVVDDTWRFQHAKVRDGLLAMIPADIAKQHHQQVAQAIEQVYPDDPQYAAQLMVHWGQAGHPEKEGVYAYQAGTHAASNYANDDAIAYLTRAYELASTMNWADDDPATKRQYDILCKREEVYRLTGQPARQKADLDLLAALVDVLDKPEYHVEVALRQAGYTRTVTDFDAYRVFAERAVTQAHLAEDDLLVAKAYRLMGEALSTFHDYDGAINAFETACPLAEELEQYWELGRILTGLGMIANYKSEYDKAKAYYKQSLQMYKTIGDERSQAMTLTKLGVTTIRLAQYQETQGYLDESLEINVRIGYKLGEKMALHVLGMLCMSRGEPDQAQAFYQQGLAIAQQLGDKEGIAAAFNSLAGVMRVKGQIEEAYDYYLEGLKNYQAIGEKYGEAVALVNLGANRRNRPGVFEQAKQHLEESVRISGQLGNVDLEAYGFLCLGLLLSFFGDYKPAQSYFENVLVTYQQIGMRSREGETGHFLGGCLVAQHLFEPAKQHLQNAVMINREIGDAELIISTLNLLAWIAYLHGEYAQMLAYYQEALSEPTQDSIPAPHEQLVSQAGAAWSSLLVNGTYVESDIMPSLRYLDSDPLLLRQVGPFRLHLICYKLLQAVGDPRADEVLILAHEQIQTYASYIETPEWRASFLSNVPEQRELEDLYIARFSV